LTIILILKLPVNMATKAVSKLPKITFLHLFFSHENWFQSAATSRWIDME
jgi:hypothetical protein